MTAARLDDIDWTEVDFIDFGSGIGGSLQSAEKRTGGRGVGIEMRAAKVEIARREGRNVVLGDIFDLPTDLSVRYVTIDNVLEHLPSMDLVEAALHSATRIAGEFVYIRHPSFEDEPYLNARGLKQFWTDWPTSCGSPTSSAPRAGACTRYGLQRTAPTAPSCPSAHPRTSTTTTPSATAPNPTWSSRVPSTTHGTS
jgi:hypothetical protein